MNHDIAWIRKWIIKFEVKGSSLYNFLHSPVTFSQLSSHILPSKKSKINLRNVKYNPSQTRGSREGKKMSDKFSIPH
jgi:hypothetical protein